MNDAGLQFKFLVPDELVGQILGRSGATVNAIRDATGVFIQFSRPGTAVSSSSDRMLTMAGESVAAACAAFDLMIDALATRVRRGGGGGGGVAAGWQGLPEDGCSSVAGVGKEKVGPGARAVA